MISKGYRKTNGLLNCGAMKSIDFIIKYLYHIYIFEHKTDNLFTKLFQNCNIYIIFVHFVLSFYIK
ncbi:hypothetical protein EUBDOL_00531 [Amedibacillus dolichus DSM 3991]|uniref:Uncharacterized protein n=1 Tax=Amedibacillus dolichus DSM 3991 TaxID=428127 RepID=A8R9E8_9FIRM|nr:hypothetical protein EUBDOL_00531 [Amedibacillus dolichus DSM 3991]